METENLDLREAFVDELIELAASEPRLVVLDADVSRTSRSRRFRDTYPDRFFDMGVAEADMTGVAAGLASVGRIPVAITFAVFATMRAAEPLRTSICYPNLNAKVIGGYGGISDSKDGATHHSLEDVAIARAFPNLVVLAPSDGVMARKTLRAAVAHTGPTYIRLEYGTPPPVHDPGIEFHIGHGVRLRHGRDVTIASYGTAVVRALEAAGQLADEGIEADVLDVVSLKPLDTDLLLESVAITGALVTLEDHNVVGGLGSAAASEILEAGLAPAFKRVGIADTFTESAARVEDLHRKYGLGSDAVVEAVRSLIRRRVGTTGGRP
jgi:transketolase